MFYNDIPKTIGEARRYRYRVWAVNLNGLPYVEGRCAMEVHDDYGCLFHQCSKKNGHGPGKLYCKQHAKKLRSRS